jgi:non-specific serine/threonine protein kinase
VIAELNGGAGVADDAGQSVFDGIISLVEKSLLRPAAGLPSAEPRYQMLETVRAYGLEQLAASGEEAAAHLAHATFALFLATQSQDRVFAPDHLEQLARLEAEYDNVRAALEWAAESDANAELGLRLATALGPFWNFRSHFREGRHWFDQFLGRAETAPLGLRAVAQSRAAWLACLQGAGQDAEPLLTAGLRDAGLVGDRWTEGIALLGLATIHLQQGQLLEAEAWNTRALECFQELEATTIGAPQYVGVAYYLLGQIVLAQGDTTRAAELLEEAVNRQRALNFDWGLSGALRILGHLARNRGNYDAALAHYRESLELFHNRGDILAMPETLSAIASVAVAQGQMERAVRLYAAATILGQEVDIPVAGLDRAAYDRGLAEARAALPVDASAAAWAAGSALSLAEMLAEALTVPEPLDQTEPQPARSDAALPEDSLTPRERELLPLLAQGLTDREIAAALSISPRTVGYHVTNLLSKLQVESRTAAVAYALRQGLI